MIHQEHYYGDRVRSYLVAIGIIMVATMPFFIELIDKPVFFPILAVLAFVVLGGWMNPRQKTIAILSALVSAVAFVAFEYYAVTTSQTLGLTSGFFLVNQILALISIIATYFGVKSVRGFIIGHEE